MNAKAEKKKSTKRVIKIAVIIGIVIAVIICAFTFTKNVADISRLKAQIANAQEQYDDQVEENDSLREILDSENKDEYIEQKAREKGYVKDGETIYYDISSSK